LTFRRHVLKFIVEVSAKVMSGKGNPPSGIKFGHIYMKKCCIALLLLLCAGFSLYAQSSSRVTIFLPPVTGYGRSQDENKDINIMLANELASRRYTVVNVQKGANYTLYGLLGIFDEYDDYENRYINQIRPTTTYTFNTPMEEYYDGLYIFQLILRNVKTGEVVLQNVVYASFDDVYNFFPVMMNNLFTHISGPGSGPAEDNGQWKNKWLYFRASFDYPITFYFLQSDGLKGGIGLFNSDTLDVSPIDHKIIAMPGATLGVEAQFFKFFNAELNLQLSLGDPRNNYFVNTAMGLELKVPVKFDSIMLIPYGAFLYTLNVSPVFSEFPRFSAGAGIQLCTRAGKRGAVFVDVKYMFSFTDAVMHNPYLAFPPGPQQMFPEPAVIHYRHSYLGLGIGYKIGILDKTPRR